jgi:MFS family permease
MQNEDTAMTTWEIIRWWELRRLLYNAILFAIGIASNFAMEFLVQKVIPVGKDAPELETGLTVVAYGIMANLCYTFGWIVELIGRRNHRVEARARAKKQFLWGFWFSCLLTAAPFWLGLVFWLSHRTR